VKDLRDVGCGGAAISAGLLGALFADDIVLVLGSQADMQWCLDVPASVLVQVEARCVSMSKTKLMRIGNTEEYDNAAPLHIGDSIVERVDRYHSTWGPVGFTEDGKWEAEFQEWMQKVSKMWARNCHFFADKHIPIHTRAGLCGAQRSAPVWSTAAKFSS